ncbi:MAG: DUF167 domain-containing protein [Nitrospira sp.]|nr:DUF167 domain-containing protein [Nitrospira sp.]
MAALPADGAAHVELCRFLARLCGVPLSAIQILRAGSRQKRVFVKGRSAEQLFQRFQAEGKGGRHYVMVQNRIPTGDRLPRHPIFRMRRATADPPSQPTV